MDDDWKKTILVRASSLDFSAIRSDVDPFLEHHSDATLLTQEKFAALLT